MDANTVGFVERLWHLIEKGGVGLILFLLLLTLGYICYKAILPIIKQTAEALKAQNEKIMAQIDLKTADTGVKFLKIEESFKHIEKIFSTCANEITNKMQTQQDMSKERDEFLKELISQQLKIMGENQVKITETLNKISSTLEILARSKH